jgi:hypothetical protein
MGVSYWKHQDSDGIQIRLKWSGDKWCKNSPELLDCNVPIDQL